MTDFQSMIIPLMAVGGVIYIAGMTIYRMYWQKTGESFDPIKALVSMVWALAAGAVLYFVTGTFPTADQVVTAVSTLISSTNVPGVLPGVTAILFGLFEQYVVKGKAGTTPLAVDTTTTTTVNNTAGVVPAASGTTQSTPSVSVDTITVDILGLIFYNTTGNKSPLTDLTIKKTDLDVSSQMIEGRFVWANPTGETLAIEAMVTVDGDPVQFYGGSMIHAGGKEGSIDVSVFKYPNTAKAAVLGKHTVIVTPGYHPGVMGSTATLETALPATIWGTPKTFTITLQ